MPGVRRTAVLAAAFLLLSEAWATAQSPRQHVLPAGTLVVFVTDAPLDAGRREGDVVSVHLRDNLVLDGTVLAAAGTHAQLLVGGITAPDGRRRPAVSLDRFTINAGLMPVKSVEPIVPPVPAGALIDATTLAEVDHIGERWSIRIPFPFQLSGDQPASAYTPTPARTASARTMMRPEPKSSASPPPTAAPSATPVPEPAPTKIPG
jgi:hypothetical protein